MSGAPLSGRRITLAYASPIVSVYRGEDGDFAYDTLPRSGLDLSSDTVFKNDGGRLWSELLGAGATHVEAVSADVVPAFNPGGRFPWPTTREKQKAEYRHEKQSGIV